MTSRLRPSLCICVALAYVVMTVAHTAALTRMEEYDPDPLDPFTYEVHDFVTRDVKSQQESRDGVSYSLVDADGSRRTVRYSAGPLRDFYTVIHTDVNTHPVQERPNEHQVHIPLTVTHSASTPLFTTAGGGPATGIRPEPSSDVRPFLQYIGVRPSYRFAGAPYYQLRPVT